MDIIKLTKEFDNKPAYINIANIAYYKEIEENLTMIIFNADIEGLIVKETVSEINSMLRVAGNRFIVENL